MLYRHISQLTATLVKLLHLIVLQTSAQATDPADWGHVMFKLEFIILSRFVVIKPSRIRARCKLKEPFGGNVYKPGV
jgi:hypothetical protein